MEAGVCPRRFRVTSVVGGHTGTAITDTLRWTTIHTHIHRSEQMGPPSLMPDVLSSLSNFQEMRRPDLNLGYTLENEKNERGYASSSEGSMGKCRWEHT